ncbi:M15 family metallopeptidase [Bacillus cihuensis]|uniref:M15 family metallopeptidase n=1 Tax=Bacillus cihuensis TaxID=1208599 RepID=UPI000684A4D6|nr:M15 family metallopeptidase [Bacillus cihuensis]
MSVTTTCRDINELHPVAQRACRLFLDECKKASIYIFITETYRSQARQDYLYAQGRTRQGQKVTWTLKSNHTGRMAWDIAVSPPLGLYDVNTLKKAGEIAKKLGITWGGTWSTPDMPHFEVKVSWTSPVFASAVKEEKKEEPKVSGNKPNWADWQWQEAAEIYKKARGNGILSSDQWEKKASEKSLTFDEIDYLNLVLNGRLL